VSYHPTCLRIGAPFTTQLDDEKGLCCTPDATLYLGFICEACHVRSVYRRELQRTPMDVTLLMLERATIIDVYNHWSHGTMKAYKSKLNAIKDFETAFDLPVVPRPTMVHPPDSASRPLMRTQERYSLCPARWKRSSGLPDANVKWGTIRGLRSAAALQSTFNLLQSVPGQLTFGFRDKPTVLPACNLTDELGYTVFSDGMKCRIGDQSFPSAVLLDQHVTWMDKHCLQVF
jgi:hypothetical protein